MTKPDLPAAFPKQEKHCPTAIYADMLRRFTETGEVPEEERYANDALAGYLLQTMADPQVRRQVLGDEVSARIFTDTMLHFIALNLEKANYRLQRAGAELKQRGEASNWSRIKRRDNWQALLQWVDGEYAQLGFERTFYDHEFGNEGRYAEEGAWQNFLEEWRHFYEARAERQKQEFIEERREMQNRLLQNNLNAAPEYLRRHAVPNGEFYQTWALMGGRWNSVEFERLRRVALLQRKYKVLEEVARRMGRKADPEGRQRIGTAAGNTEPLAHASRSDIAGIGLGNDLNALLPLELAHYMDEELENVFLQKYVTGRLQTFDYRSHMLRPARSLHTRPARRKGPMVVCVDRSGSMAGEPGQIALSLLMRLTELCHDERRDCFLIAFSVRAQPIDVMRDRSLLLRFFAQRPGGDTDAQHMLDTTFGLLRGNPRYAGADVLWVTDYRIPLPPAEYLQEMEKMRQGDTRFYGLQIGIAENRWLQHFDKVFHIEDVRMPLA